MASDLILASSSPRRRDILRRLALPFQAIRTAIDERPLDGETPEGHAGRLALAKAEDGAVRFPGAVVLAADTVVALDGASLGKPRSPEEALEMLRALRGRAHWVITSVAVTRAPVIAASDRPASWSRTAMTQVWMRVYGDEEIAATVASGQPFDKAGAYAIQDARFHPVERIEGCYLNVVGLPLPEVLAVLEEAGWDPSRIDRATIEAVCSGCTDLARLGI